MAKGKKQKFSKPLIAAVVLGIIVVSYFVYIFAKIQLDERQFSKIENSIDQVTIAMKQSNQYSSIAKSKYCSKDQGKYNTGNLNCSIEVSATVALDGQNLDNIINNSASIFKNNGFQEIVPVAQVGSVKTGQFKHQSTNSNCYPSYMANESSGSEAQTVDIKFYCVRRVDRAIYPMH